MKQWQTKIGVLEVMVFTGGTIVMVLEIIGARIMAPFLGTSIFVWSALIGIILGALSLGYALGGRWSKKNPRLSRLGLILFAGGLAIFAIPLIKELVLAFSQTLGVQYGSVVAALGLFALPSVILGMISPYAIRLRTHQVEESGGVAGNLYAISTVGSIVGTFLAGFYLIPSFNTTDILFGLSGVLVLTSLLTTVSVLRIFMGAVLVLFWAVTQFIPSPYVFETNSTYNHIRVVDFTRPDNNRPVRGLYLATELHSIIYQDSDEIASGYISFYHLDDLFAPDIKRALTLGGGAYVSVIDFLKRHPQATMTAVEIDPTVTQVAREYFGLTDNPNLTIHHQDGRIFLNQNKQQFDVIYGDAFSSFFSIPFHLTTREAFQLMYDALTEDGVLLINTISALEGEKSLFFKAAYKTIGEVFPSLYLFPTRHPSSGKRATQNIIIIAAKTPKMTLEALVAEASTEQQTLLEHFWESPDTLDPDIRVLTDDFAPVDYYISKLL